MHCAEEQLPKRAAMFKTRMMNWTQTIVDQRGPTTGRVGKMIRAVEKVLSVHVVINLSFS